MWKILKSPSIVNLHREVTMLKLKINLPQLLCIVISAAENGEFERFGGFSVDCYYTENPPNRSNSPFSAAEMTINNN